MEERCAFNQSVTKELLDSVQVGDLVKCNDCMYLRHQERPI